MTRTLAALQEEGFIGRMTDPDDRRQSMVTITGPGRQALREEMHPRDQWVARTIQSELTATERELLVLAARVMERLSEVDLFPGVPER